MSSHLSIDQNNIKENRARREAAMEFLLGRIDYERMRNMPYRKREFKLDRMRELLDRLGNPQQDLPVVHVAGTKGKGSTAAMIGAILTAAGHRVGVFSSPHLDRIEQRMAVAGRPCSGNELVELVDHLKPAVEAMDRAVSRDDPSEYGPTYFEITTAVAWLHFVRQRVDAAVLEVGLGGRLDSTNVCRPRVCVITNISLDHTKQLGTTPESIAREKAGIVKSGVPVVSGVTEAGPRDIIRQICHDRGSPLIELGPDFDFDYQPPRHLEKAPAAGRLDFRFEPRDPSRGVPHAFADLPLELLGRHQAANAAVALAALAELRQTGWNVPEEAVRAGLGEVVWPARVEVVARRPAVVLDAAHNLASIVALTDALDTSFSVARRLLIFATTEEKDCRGMLGHLLKRFDEVVFTRYLNNPRAVPPEQLAALARELTGRDYPTYADPATAWDALSKQAGPEDLICIAGSFFIAAEMRRQLATLPLPEEPEASEWA